VDRAGGKCCPSPAGRDSPYQSISAFAGIPLVEPDWLVEQGFWTAGRSRVPFRVEERWTLAGRTPEAGWFKKRLKSLSKRTGGQRSELDAFASAEAYCWGLFIVSRLQAREVPRIGASGPNCGPQPRRLANAQKELPVTSGTTSLSNGSSPGNGRNSGSL